MGQHKFESDKHSTQSWIAQIANIWKDVDGEVWILGSWFWNAKGIFIEQMMSNTVLQIQLFGQILTLVKYSRERLLKTICSFT
jgi:hypothetical protein